MLRQAGGWKEGLGRGGADSGERGRMEWASDPARDRRAEHRRLIVAAPSQAGSMQRDRHDQVVHLAFKGESIADAFVVKHERAAVAGWSRGIKTVVLMHWNVIPARHLASPVVVRADAV